MPYVRGKSANIIAGAVTLFVADNILSSSGVNAPPPFFLSQSYKDTLSDNSNFRNAGYTTNGLEIQFQPDFNEVRIDQLLDAAKLYRSGMKITLSTTFVEATLENLLLSLAYDDNQITGTSLTSNGISLDLYPGYFGKYPIERGIVAIGPGSGDCINSSQIEHVFIAYRALSIDDVTVSAKRDEATTFNVSFRLLPEDTGRYGKIVDRSWMQLNTQSGYGEGNYGDGPYGL